MMVAFIPAVGTIKDKRVFQRKKIYVPSFREIGGRLKGKVVTDMACYWDCSAALTIEGTLFLWGSNCFGQLGKHPSYLQWAHEPFKIVIDRKIKGISFGLRHTALITEDQKIFVAGTNNKGQLGLSPAKNKEIFNIAYTFTEVSTLENIENVSCSQRHTIAMKENGNFYVFGDNKHGQLGLDPNIFLKTWFPLEPPNVRFKSPVDTHCGWSHTITLSDGQIFSGDRNTYGQLDVIEFEKSSNWKHLRIENLAKVYQVSAGSKHVTFH